jgi:hypothetical protein
MQFSVVQEAYSSLMNIWLSIQFHKNDKIFTVCRTYTSVAYVLIRCILQSVYRVQLMASRNLVEWLSFSRLLFKKRPQIHKRVCSYEMC